jgi:hypothetical protein
VTGFTLLLFVLRVGERQWLRKSKRNKIKVKPNKGCEMNSLPINTYITL